MHRLRNGVFRGCTACGCKEGNLRSSTMQICGTSVNDAVAGVSQNEIGRVSVRLCRSCSLDNIGIILKGVVSIQRVFRIISDLMKKSCGVSGC